MFPFNSKPSVNLPIAPLNIQRMCDPYIVRLNRLSPEHCSQFSPETIRHPEVSGYVRDNRRQHIVVNDFRDILYYLSGMMLDKKDFPTIWYKLIQGLTKCQGASKMGLREREALLNQHNLAFVMRMTFNLSNLVAKLLTPKNSGSLKVRNADRKNLDRYFLNYELSRDLLDQFEQESYEFSQASTWTDLSLFAKRSKSQSFFTFFV